MQIGHPRSLARHDHVGNTGAQRCRGVITSSRVFPDALSGENRALLGPLCLYAPSILGSVARWRGFPHEPWSPDIDLVVAVADRTLAESFGARADDPRYVVDDLFVCRRASRGVPLSTLLGASAKSGGGRPPVELLARTALALLRPGPRLARVRCPHQVIVSFDGDVFVDSLDPEVRLRAWAPHAAHEAHVHAALLAACAGGSEHYPEAALLVEDARRSSASANETGAVARLLNAVGGNDASAALDELAALPADKSVVAGVLRGLFPVRAAAVDGFREELALLDRRVLPAWPHAREVVSEAELVFAELREHADRCRALIAAAPARLAVDPWWRRPWRTLVDAFSR
jgi:hypothetical protein